MPPTLASMHDVDDYPDAQTIPGLVVYRYDAPLCFATAQGFRRRRWPPPKRGPSRWVVRAQRGVFGLAGKLGADQLFPTLPAALGAYRKRAAEHHG